MWYLVFYFLVKTLLMKLCSLIFQWSLNTQFNLFSQSGIIIAMIMHTHTYIQHLNNSYVHLLHYFKINIKKGGEYSSSKRWFFHFLDLMKRINKENKVTSLQVDQLFDPIRQRFSLNLGINKLSAHSPFCDVLNYRSIFNFL